MAKKLKLAVDDSARKASFIKRKRRLLKKVREVSTLSGVKACAIIYGPYDAQPDIWPTPAEACHVLNRFKSIPESSRSKSILNQVGFLTQRIEKLKETLKKQQVENRTCEITQLMHQSFMGEGLPDVAIEELCDMAWLMQVKRKELKKRIEELKKVTPEMPLPHNIPGNRRVVKSEIPDIMGTLRTPAMPLSQQIGRAFASEIPNIMGPVQTLTVLPSQLILGNQGAFASRIPDMVVPIQTLAMQRPQWISGNGRVSSSGIPGIMSPIQTVAVQPASWISGNRRVSSRNISDIRGPRQRYPWFMDTVNPPRDQQHPLPTFPYVGGYYLVMPYRYSAPW